MKTWRVVPIALASAILATGLSAQSAPTTPQKSAAPPAVAQVPKLPTQGNVNTHYVRVGAGEFSIDSSSVVYSTPDWFPPASVKMLRYVSSGYNHVYAFAHIPGGSVLTYVELDGCDTNATNHMTLDVYDCDYDGNCTAPPMATMTSDGSGCSDWTASPSSYTMNNYDNQVLLDLTFGANDGSNKVAGAIVGWQYQVSPAPGTATFGDVPTSNPFFQYVEALSASGITGGCGGGNFCPDQPVLRKQMATFLAKALGLFWGGY
jgi:hypothetical protein